MSYMFAVSPCLCCKQPFPCNPDKVPSLTVDGTREPICSACMEQANAKRVEMGIEPHPIHPEAYGVQQVHY